jgi:hypothetical protein
MEATIKPAERIRQMANHLGLTIDAEFVPWSKSRKKGEKQPSLNWRVTVLKDGKSILTIDYTAGCGHCPGNSFSFSIMRREVIAWECEHGKSGSFFPGLGAGLSVLSKPILPTIEDVLSSLVLDSDSINYSTFEEWADKFGYDQDSRKAEATYRACLDIALKMRNGIGEDGLRSLREACQDY